MRYLILITFALLISCGDGSVAKKVIIDKVVDKVNDPVTVDPPPVEDPDPVFQAEVVKGTGDRFDPVLIDVSYTLEGEEIEWDFEYSANRGQVERTDTGLAIYGDALFGTGQIVINDEEYQYEIVEEPLCEIEAVTDTERYDCAGYQITTAAQEYIYYGPEDTRIVTWEILYIGRVGTLEEGPVEPDSRLINEAEATIYYANEKFRQWGVYVELKLVGIAGYNNPNGGTRVQKYIDDGTLPDADFIAVQGATPGGICGFAGQSAKFKGRTFPLRFLNGCGLITWLHEMGHSVGLGHGENGGVNSGGGSHWLFAKGGSICGYRSDVMQYGGSDATKAFSNHTRTCGETFNLRPEQDYYDSPAGSDTNDQASTSTGYVINRVRYDVSLVHDERQADLGELSLVKVPDYYEVEVVD